MGDSTKGSGETIGYELPADDAERVRKARASITPTGAQAAGLDRTRAGLGVDRRRPPQAIPTSRKLARAVWVLLVLDDAVRRSALARALLNAGCTVLRLESIEPLARRTELQDVEIVLVDLDAKVALAALGSTLEHAPKAAVLALATRIDEARQALATLGLAEVEVLAHGAGLPEVLGAVQRLGRC